MNAQDFADMIRLARRAPLANMDEAEHVNGLLQRVAEHADKMLIEVKSDDSPSHLEGGS